MSDLDPSLEAARPVEAPLAERPPVAAVVPAFNEEDTLAEVIDVLRETPLVDEIVVVSDGSTDGTAEVGEALGARTLRLPENRGKGRALAAGVAATEAPILVFVDADILNLSEYLLEQLIDPVLAGRVAMNIGVRNRGWINPFHRRFGPHLSGIRCLEREIFEAVPAGYRVGFRIEVAMNWACRRLGRKLGTTVLFQLKHRVKERKRGFAAGLRARLRMFADVFRAWLTLRLRPPAAPADENPRG